MLRRLWSVPVWLFRRLPLGFSIPLVVLAALWMAGFQYLDGPLRPLLRNALAWLSGTEEGAIFPFLEGVFVVVLFAVGVVAVYNLAALCNWTLLTLSRTPGGIAPARPVPPTDLPRDDEFEGISSIGIVLAGGGAKGAFQAGAMRAIYRYLEAKGALTKVRVITGTSIGSWNALFWLSDLVKPEVGWDGESFHQRWWGDISAKALTAPSWYVPMMRNAVLSAEPWKRQFDAIFGSLPWRERLERSGLRFYLTRANVGSGQLECATNDPHPPALKGVRFEWLDPRADGFISGLKNAVFTSMDLPPLFPYADLGNQYFEDGGVIDNLPIVFAAQSGCDLIFVLPLNSDFRAEPNRRSILARLFRVMDIRQGVLERKAFRDLYLYNELAALREHAKGLQARASPPIPVPPHSHLAYALNRKHGVIDVFAVCPHRSLVRTLISTKEFWRRKEAAQAFRTMDGATWTLLGQRPFATRQEEVRLAVVDAPDHWTWDEDL